MLSISICTVLLIVRNTNAILEHVSTTKIIKKKAHENNLFLERHLYSGTYFHDGPAYLILFFYERSEYEPVLIRRRKKNQKYFCLRILILIL